MKRIILYILALFIITLNALAQQEISSDSLLRKAREFALQGKAEQASQRFYNALKPSLPDSLIEALFLDIRDILTVEEVASFRQAEDKAAWLQTFWQRLDPTPATVANERLIEHYQRLHIARTRYRSPQPRGYDDRGMVYLRYGEPDDIFISPLGRLTRGNESWVYHRLGDVSFDFVEYGGLYRLVTDLRKAIESVPQNLNGLIGLWKGLFEQRQNLSLRYQITANKLNQILHSISEDIPPQVAFAQAERTVTYEYIDRNEEKKRFLPQHTTDFVLPEKHMDIIISYAIFADKKASSLKNSRLRLELYYAIPLQQLHAVNLFQEDSHRDIKMYFSVFTKNYQLVVRKIEIIALNLAAVLSLKDYLGQLTFFLQPDTYRVALDIQSPQTNQRGMMQMLVAVPSSHQDQARACEATSSWQLPPSCARLLPEDKEKGFIKHGLYVRPYPYPRQSCASSQSSCISRFTGLFLGRSRHGVATG
ncbi:MAG: GWxTD domain-containing protein [candidate division KSB1 bacterium]|nr:GWxTD domain-containing protein [candidate division KSB1 bacterium]